jgi:SNF2 family DNA or RNA helicase
MKPHPQVFHPYDYQNTAYQHILDKPKAGVLLEMGLGKTVVTLTALRTLLFEWFDVCKPLIIAPKRVVESVWLQEVAKWKHLQDLKGVVVLGTEAERIQALKTPADFHVINRDNVTWLVNYYKTAFPFDMIIIDELSSFKSPKSQRFRSLKMALPKVRRVVGLTGTPAPNGLIDLWSQMYLLDGGERLGLNISEYRRKYFEIASASGHVVYKYALKQGADKLIYNKINDICVSMSAKDYLKLPDRIDNVIKIRMDSELRRKYNEFEEDQVLQLRDAQITAVNAAVLTNKLLQFANGAIYDENKVVAHIHDLKLDALEQLVDEAQGQPVLVGYSFQHDADRIKKRFKDVREMKTDKDVRDWNSGKVPLMIAHPASAGHGLNLQHGGHIAVWYGLNWSLELFEQFNARLLRPGQEHKVIVHFLLLEGTMDEDVLAALNRKARGQSALMDAVKARIDKYELAVND